jgi:hypothetical protein
MRVNSFTIFLLSLFYCRQNLCQVNKQFFRRTSWWSRYVPVVLGYNSTYFSNKIQKGKTCYSEEQVIGMLEFLIDNIFVSSGGTHFQLWRIYQWKKFCKSRIIDRENVINIPVCEIKDSSLMNLLIFYKLLRLKICCVRLQFHIFFKQNSKR